MNGTLRTSWLLAGLGLGALVVGATWYGSTLPLRLVRAPETRPLEPAADTDKDEDKTVSQIRTGRVLVKLRAADFEQLAREATESPSPSAEPTTEPSPSATPSSTPTESSEPSPTTDITPSPSAEASPKASSTPPSPEGDGDVLGASTQRRGRVLAATSTRNLFSAISSNVEDIRFIVPPAITGRAGGRTSRLLRTQTLTEPEEPLADIDRWVEVDLNVPEKVAEVKGMNSLEPAKSETASAVQETKEAIEELKSSGKFEAVEPVVMYKTDGVLNDPYLTSTGLGGRPYDDLWGIKRVQAPAAWNVNKGSANVIVAVTDTGIDLSHRDLAGALWENAGEKGNDAQGRSKQTNGLDDDQNGYVDDWSGWDMGDDDNDPSDSVNGHGTHVSGTIGARGGNGLDVVGIAPEVPLMAVKIFSNYRDYAYSSDCAEGIRYAANKGAKVVNMSWGAPVYTQIIADAVAYAAGKDAVLVAAAGNRTDNMDYIPYYPSGHPEVIAVSAWTPHNRIATFSNYGTKIELTAPGGDWWGFALTSILSLRARNTLTGSSRVVNEYLAVASGTSMASPHVAGVAALVRSEHPEWTSAQVREQLNKTADDVDAAGRDVYSGFGVVNAARALGQPSVEALITSPFHRDGNPEITLTPTNRTIEVRGTAAGSGFLGYRVEVGKGLAPTSWTVLKEQQTPVRDGVLAQWDTNGQAITNNDDYTFRLTVNPDQPDRIQLLAGIVTILATSPPTTAPPSTNRPPTFSLPSRVEVRAGQTLTLPLSASDPDGDNVTYRVGDDSRGRFPGATISP